jgi:hypothetical protein
MLSCQSHRCSAATTTKVQRMRDDRNVRDGIVPNSVPGQRDQLARSIDDPKVRSAWASLPP